MVFQQSAGITNPAEAGGWEVKVSTENIGGTSESIGSGDVDFVRVVALSGSSGTRGGTVTVTGKGFRKDLTAVVWVEDLGDTTPDMKTGAETELCSATVAKNATFTCQFVVNASNFTAGKNRTINASDGRSQEAAIKPSWKLLGKVTAVPDSAAIGETVSLEFVDFPAGTISTLTLGGVDVLYDARKITPMAAFEGLTLPLPHRYPWKSRIPCPWGCSPLTQQTLIQAPEETR